jgi:glucose/arabinose dehydrogenase
MKKIVCTLFVLLTHCIYAQTAQLTPVIDMGTHTLSVSVPAKYSTLFPAGKVLTVPANYSVSVFYAGSLTKPRFMAFSPAGILHVSDMALGKVFALPDADMNGIADTIMEAATGFSGNHDVKFYKGAMYVTEATRIWKCTDLDANGTYETKTIFINNISNQGGGHTTRTVVFDSIHQKVYVSVGSSCNVCRETNRAIIERYDENGTNRVVFATGVRNGVGMTMHPVTHKLWANNNGSDQQGNETPPEWIDIVRENGFYGHPFAYGSGVWFDFNTGGYQSLLPITAIDSANVASLVAPAALIRAHSAPMALEFLTPQFGPSMQHGFISALRGSWNTTNPNDFRGYKVIYGHLTSAQDTTVDYVSDFCSGFITDTVNRIFWGRPVGLATDNSGKVYISSDEANRFILVLTPINVLGVEDNTNMFAATEVYPNPLENEFTLLLSLNQQVRVNAELTDVFGRHVKMVLDKDLQAGENKQRIDVSELSRGIYFLKITAGQTSITKKLILIK